MVLKNINKKRVTLIIPPMQRKYKGKADLGLGAITEKRNPNSFTAQTHEVVLFSHSCYMSTADWGSQLYGVLM